MVPVSAVHEALTRHTPARLTVEGARRAAVAMVLTESEAGGAEVLFIERARHPLDPWSGHMAFPGGRVDPDDDGARAAAERETLEEVGISLTDATLLGRLDDKQGNPVRHPALVISAYVYHAASPGQIVTNHEVEQAFWFPLHALLDPARHVHFTSRGELEFPGILVGEPDRHVVWGLTYSFLESFFEVLGSPLPDRWTDDMRRFARHLAR
jgi:8-oxo-dGTP pyrophosphatase MutT (NUDIX family)